MPTKTALIVRASVMYSQYCMPTSWGPKPTDADRGEFMPIEPLVRHNKCIDDFKHIATPQKKEIIRHRCFNVQLPRSVASKGIWKLCSVLSTWTLANSLALEINNIYVSFDDVEHDENPKPDTWRVGSQYHDPKPGWMHGRQVRSPPKTAILRFFRPIFSTVTCLINRRQLRRCNLPSTLDLLLRSFDRLEHISYEPWASYEDEYREYNENHRSCFVMRNYLLNRLIVFEDSYKFYDSFKTRPVRIPLPGYNLFDPSEGLGPFFASKSLDLQHLAVSFMEKYNQIQTLLYQAGILVHEMPKLHTFVLWNGGKAHACVFIYRVGRDNASVIWRGTWDLELSPDMIKSWQLVASKLPYYEFSVLQIKYEHIGTTINSHGDAIYHLELPC
ncbi:hypothetical protein F5Y09DRAFT_328053 [Xylaria sp. FL1042]|nr:hypothetical protein F5Y09DRAFT_328053 [Xylaria sp. FL1042]